MAAHAPTNAENEKRARLSRPLFIQLPKSFRKCSRSCSGMSHSSLNPHLPQAKRVTTKATGLQTSNRMTLASSPTGLGTIIMLSELHLGHRFESLIWSFPISRQVILQKSGRDGRARFLLIDKHLLEKLDCLRKSLIGSFRALQPIRRRMR